jgi:hypothetical protein
MGDRLAVFANVSKLWMVGPPEIDRLTRFSGRETANEGLIFFANPSYGCFLLKKIKKLPEAADC